MCRKAALSKEYCFANATTLFCYCLNQLSLVLTRLCMCVHYFYTHYVFMVSLSTLSVL